MKKLICYYGDSPVHVEGFPKDCARSCEGSLHILPRKSKTVTDAEFDYIQEKYPWMKSKLKVIAKIGSSDPRNQAKGKAEKPTPEADSKGKDESKTEPAKPSQMGDTKGKEKEDDKSKDKSKSNSRRK